ncbi:hypothetical protein LTR53_001601 [Teratosphaeriaceae sp. CCFEE 6253]|nr:hypothetical protein LTR53_001601 [Teratosphaeriaceae sp. CCFEE 6253]
MPLIYLSYSEGTFSLEALNIVANQITRDGEELEKIPLTEWALSTTWVYARAYPTTHVFHGGKPGGNNFVTVDINIIQGGYSATKKTELMKRITGVISKHGAIPKGEPPRIYVLIREVAEANWGFDGQPINLEALRYPATADGQTPP